MKRPALLLLLVLAAGCSNGAGKASPAPATSSTAPAATTAAPTAPATPAPSGTGAAFVEPVYFRTPTGNIGCGIEATAAVCDILEKTWTPPPKPASCQWDWGFGLYVSSNPPGKGQISCASDTVYNAESPALAYGKTMTRNGFTCESRQDGVRCTHDTSRHGFFLSRDRYELF